MKTRTPPHSDPGSRGPGRADRNGVHGGTELLDGGPRHRRRMVLLPEHGGQPRTSDPNSTSLVIQAMIALGLSPSGPTFDQGANTPVTALLAFQVTSGADLGAFYFPGIGSTTTGNVVATYQVVPALAGLPCPFGPAARGVRPTGWSPPTVASIPSATPPRTGQPPPSLHEPIVGMAATPDGQGYWLVAPTAACSASATPPSTARSAAPAQPADRRHGRHPRRRGLLVGGLRRRHVQLR